MHLAQNYLGYSGENESFEEPHDRDIPCNCGSNARLALVVAEEGGLGERNEQERKINHKLICDLRENGDKKWPHDVMTLAIYICANCGKAQVEWNQA